MSRRWGSPRGKGKSFSKKGPLRLFPGFSSFRKRAGEYPPRFSLGHRLPPLLPAVRRRACGVPRGNGRRRGTMFRRRARSSWNSRARRSRNVAAGCRTGLWGRLSSGTARSWRRRGTPPRRGGRIGRLRDRRGVRHFPHGPVPRSLMCRRARPRLRTAQTR